MAYISEFDRQQLLTQIAGIKSDLAKNNIEISSIKTSLRAMGMTLAERDKMPFCQQCGEVLTYKCKKCE